MVKALADRLAEAFAEYLHAEARREWGYGRGERLAATTSSPSGTAASGPAFGYPACPDHSEKCKLFDLLDAGDVGITLTEARAMLPAASVSGLYFAHPQARYFTVGRIGRDQVEDYARRKGMSRRGGRAVAAPLPGLRSRVIGTVSPACFGDDGAPSPRGRLGATLEVEGSPA